MAEPEAQDQMSIHAPADLFQVPPRGGLLRRALRRPIGLVALGYLAVVVGVAIIAPILLRGVGHQYAGNLSAVSQGPSLAHWLGTDSDGRDVLERLLVGTRVTVIGVSEALAVVLVLGIPLGLAAGYLGGSTDRAVTWLADLTFAVPGIVIVIVVLSVFPEDMLAAMVALGLLAAPGVMRVVRSATLAVRQELYVEAAEVAGLSRPHILGRHVLPRISGAVLVQASLIAGVALVVQSGLAFLGLLVAAPAPSWGGMVANGASVLFSDSWLIWPPGIAVAVTIIALSLVGDVLRDASAESWSTVNTPTPKPVTKAKLEAPASASASAGAGILLSVQDLSIAFVHGPGSLRVVDGISFDVRHGEAVGIVGESGCGKSVTTAAILGLVPGTGRVEEGRIIFAGRDLAAIPEKELRKVRGREIALVSQEPMLSLDPTFTVGAQVQEAVRAHLGLPKAEARSRTLELLETVRLPDPKSVALSYPHELSGGIAQRVAIARALAGEPKLLIADEPTTALDVTVQSEILDLLSELKDIRRMAVVLVSHDWGVVADICDHVVVMYAGQVVEEANLTAVFDEPLHPYTKALLSSDPHHAPGTGLLATIPGVVPQPWLWPAGCRFQPRCAYATPDCTSAKVPLAGVGSGRRTRCLHHDLLARG